MAEISRKAISRNTSYLAVKSFLWFCILLVGAIEVLNWYSLHYLAAAMAFVVNWGRPIAAVAKDRAEKEDRPEDILKLDWMLKAMLVFTMVSLISLLAIASQDKIEEKKLQQPELQMASNALEMTQSRIKILESEASASFSAGEMLELIVKKQFLTEKLTAAKEEQIALNKKATDNYKHKLSQFMSEKYLCSWKEGEYNCQKSSGKGSYAVRNVMTEDCSPKRLWGGLMIRASKQLCQVKPTMFLQQTNDRIEIEKELQNEKIVLAAKYNSSLNLLKETELQLKNEYLAIYNAIDEKMLFDPIYVISAEILSNFFALLNTNIVVKAQHLSMMIITLMVVIVLVMISNLSVYVETIRDPIVVVQQSSSPKKDSLWDNILNGIMYMATRIFVFIKELLQKKPNPVMQVKPVKSNKPPDTYQTGMGFGPANKKGPDDLNIPQYNRSVQCFKAGFSTQETSTITGINSGTVSKYKSKWSAGQPITE